MTDNIYGPQTKEIEALITVIGSLDADQIEALGVAWDDAQNRAWNRAWNTARDEAWNEARNTAWIVARDEAWDDSQCAAWDATGDDARDAAWGTVLALLVRDQIGDTFTQAHYDVLTAAWRTVIGPIHPDDIDLHINKGE